MADHIENDTDTWDMPVHFKVCQYDEGGFWIMIEKVDDPTLPILSDGFLGIELHKGVGAEEAKQLADRLDERVALLTFTGKKRREWADNPGRGERARRDARRGR